MSKKWITSAEAAALSGYHPEYLRELIRTGRIDGRKFGIVWQIDKQSLLKYLRDGSESTDGRRGPRQ